MANRGLIERIGVIGLGLMGTALTERLLEHGYCVTVWNRTRERAVPLIAKGAEWSDSPLADCQRVILSLYTTQVVEQVLERFQAGLHPGLIIVDTTTGQPDQTAALGGRLATLGVHYLDAPISGSSRQTRDGEATVIVGGAPCHFRGVCRSLARDGCKRLSRRPLRQRREDEAH
jgi:3-hydroxyisobutyrate dehydrogenase-like beta-hydroxyacid dehydrogenase